MENILEGHLKNLPLSIVWVLRYCFDFEILAFERII